MSPYNNPYKYAVQKYLFDILQNSYGLHKEVIERISHYLVTEQDIKQFTSLIADLYQLAYYKAASDYRHQLAEAGVMTEVKKSYAEEFKSSALTQKEDILN